MGILETVVDEVPTTWCTNPVVAPKKNGKIRFCSNMRAPNTAIRWPMTESLTVKDVKVKLSRAKVFSKLDMNLDMRPHFMAPQEDSGTRDWTMMQFPPKTFLIKLWTILFMDCQTSYTSEMILWCMERTQQNMKKHWRHFCRDSRILVSHWVIQNANSEWRRLSFFGLKFSQGCVRPAPSQVEALQSMSEPKNASEVRSFLGMAQFSAQFIPNYSEISTPLRKLTRKSVQWKWEQDEKAAFDTLKMSLSIVPALGYYETGRETKLIVESGPHGLGLVLMQKKNRGWQPIFNASRSLTEVEQRYSQLEHEALAIRWDVRNATLTSSEVVLQ